MPGQQSTKEFVNGSIPGFCCPTCERSSCEESLTGPFPQARASLLLHGGVCGTGQRGSVGSKTEPESWEGLGCLQERVEAGRDFWWGTGGQAQVAENLDDDRGIFNGRQDGQWAAALGTGGEVDGEDAFE